MIDNFYNNKPTYPPLMFITDQTRAKDWQAIIGNLPKKAGIIFRDYGLCPLDRYQMAQEMKALCQAKGLYFFIGEDLRLALKLDAGLHLRTYQLLNPSCQIRLALKHLQQKKILVSGAVHNLKTIKAAESLDLSLILLSPIFPTKTHKEAKPLGVIRAVSLKAKTKLPVYGLGGMCAIKARRLKRGTARKATIKNTRKENIKNPIDDIRKSKKRNTQNTQHITKQKSKKNYQTHQKYGGCGTYGVYGAYKTYGAYDLWAGIDAFVSSPNKQQA